MAGARLMSQKALRLMSSRTDQRMVYRGANRWTVRWAGHSLCVFASGIGNLEKRPLASGIVRSVRLAVENAIVSWLAMWQSWPLGWPPRERRNSPIALVVEATPMVGTLAGPSAAQIV